MSTHVCPNGHTSADPEWCDTCGAPIGTTGVERRAGGSGSSTGAGTSTGTSTGTTDPTAIAPVACPHCAAMNAADNLFCESCGYDFVTGQAPEAPPPVAGAADPTATVIEAPPEAAPAGSTWIVVVEVDPAWFALKGELADQACPPPSTSTITISKHVSLIGRSSHSRGIHPEIALDTDTAVSRRHAQLVIEGEQVSVVDLSSTNGTYVLGATDSAADDPHPLTPGVPAVLRDGDRIQLGAWTRLTVRAG